MKLLSIVIPIFNEVDVLPELVSRLDSVISEQLDDLNVEIIMVDDGSTDGSVDVIKSLVSTYENYKLIRLSRNFGHQRAVIAGLHRASGDAVVIIDADLQDNLEVSSQMVEHYMAGYDIVYGIRNDRSSDSRSKRFYANFFYSLMLAMGVEIIPGHADYRLISQRALIELLRYQERALFLRGIIPLLGFKTAAVYYARTARLAGSSKYPFRKSLALAVDGIISFSNIPLRAIAYLGCAMALLAALGIIAIFINTLQGNTVQGWPSLMVALFFIGGCQLLSIGILGEYLGRIYKEVKQRPRYHLEERTKEHQENN